MCSRQVIWPQAVRYHQGLECRKFAPGEIPDNRWKQLPQCVRTLLGVFSYHLVKYKKGPEQRWACFFFFRRVSNDSHGFIAEVLIHSNRFLQQAGTLKVESMLPNYKYVSLAFRPIISSNRFKRPLELLEFWRELAKPFVGSENLKKDYRNLELKKMLVCPGRRLNIVVCSRIENMFNEVDI